MFRFHTVTRTQLILLLIFIVLICIFMRDCRPIDQQNIAVLQHNLNIETMVQDDVKNTLVKEDTVYPMTKSVVNKTLNYAEETETSSLPRKSELLVLDKVPGAKNSSEKVSSNFDSATCRIPKLRLDDPSLSKYFTKMDPLLCDKVWFEPNWVEIKYNTFQLNQEMLSLHGKITCDLAYFSWKNDFEVVFHKNVSDVAVGSPIESDYFVADCQATDGTKYTKAHATVVPLPRRVGRLEKMDKSDDWSGLNVYIFGFDSLSHMMAQRMLPKTYNYLKDNLGMVYLNGYNIVGDGTPQAFIPILTGKTEEELPNTRKRYEEADFVDVYPFVWNEFSRAGYATQFSEDIATIGTYQYRLKGFSRQPTDNYMRTFFLVADHQDQENACVGNEPNHVTFFRQSLAFFDAFPTVPKFSLMFHSVLSHDDINKVQLADDDMVTHLEAMNHHGHLNNTLVIFMADHGHRFAQIRETQQGQLEERLPLFGLALPPWFREGRGKKGWENLVKNAEKLSSPFDIHPTLLDIIHWKEEPGLGDVTQRSVSLWSEIPGNRTCAQAGIEAHWCTCLNWEDLRVSDEIVSKLSNSIVEAINKETERERQLCALLELNHTVSAKRLVPHEDLLKYRSVKDYDGFVPDLTGNVTVSFAHYQIRLRTSPGNALYDATVKYDLRDNEKIIVDLGAISHVNKYGDLPHCVIDKDYFLAKWCVCHDKI